MGVHNADFSVSSRDLRGNDFTAPLLVQISKGLPHSKTAFVLIYFFFEFFLCSKLFVEIFNDFGMYACEMKS